MQPSWDTTWLHMARVISWRSKDPRTRVGAVLVSPDNRQVAVGYNGFPPGVDDDQDVLARRKIHPSGWGKDNMVVHAEVNAVCNCTQRPAGWTMYCTHRTCNDCAKAIVACGITRVVVNPQSPTTDMATDMARLVLECCGVRYEEVAL